MRLNIGCGTKHLDGYVNVDVDPTLDPQPDMVADIRELGLADNSVDEILAVHVLEHLYLWEAKRALADWHRMLRSDGLLVLELPNALKCARNLLRGSGENLSMWGLYGDPRSENPLMAHRWGWSPGSLRKVLERVGFVGIEEQVPEFHGGGRDERDMRLVARKQA